MESIRAWQGPEDHKSMRAAVQPAAPAGARVLTEDEVGMVVGGVRQDSDPCEGGEGHLH